MLNQKPQLVSCIFLDSEQLLTYAYPPKNAPKYPPKKFWPPYVLYRPYKATK